MPSDPAPKLFQQHVATHTNPWSVGTSVAVNGAILALLLCISIGTAHLPPPTHGPSIPIGDFKIFAPSLGGSGGQHERNPASTGHPPQYSATPITPPQVRQLDRPLLPVNPAIAVPIQLPDNTSLPNLGVHSSISVILSDGPGANSGIGSGPGGGVGDGRGPGFGPGSQPGIGIERPGIGGVTEPIPIVTPEAEFSDEARRAKYQGVCMVSVIVDAQGNPQNPRVIRSLGMGLDEKALAAVRAYRFKPARKDGHPVAVMITVAVNFRLF